MSWDDEADAAASDGDEPDASSASFDYLDEPTAVDKPTGAKPSPVVKPSPGVDPWPELAPLPVVKPLPGVSVKSVTKVGTKFRVVVTAPKGAKVKVFRNGKLVANGAKTTFVIPSTTAKSARFHATTSIGGAHVVSNSVVFVTRTASRR